MIVSSRPGDTECGATLNVVLVPSRPGDTECGATLPRAHHQHRHSGQPRGGHHWGLHDLRTGATGGYLFTYDYLI